MQKWIHSLLIALLFAVSLDAAIVETPHFREISSHVDEHTLVILDIDDTLLITPQMLGCDNWFLHQQSEHQKRGLSPSDACMKAIEEWQAVRLLTEMEIVEQGTEKIVQSLQKKGHCVMGLTTQGMTLAQRTSLQLKTHQFDLSLTAPDKKEHCFMIGQQPIYFGNGILFTGGAPKGEALFTLCEKMGYTPKRIVFINDKESHLKDIEKTAEKRGVPFIGLRYAYSDARKAAFSPELAEIQFKHSRFDRLLSDAEAVKILNEQQKKRE